jgi:putative nucleotidyltransferase with HDIG domain
MHFARIYLAVVRFLGVIFVFGLVTIVMRRQPDSEIALLLVLGVMASWLRFKLESTGYVTLTPVVSFVALLLYPPYVSALVASISGIISARYFGRYTWGRGFEEGGEETLCMLLSAATFHALAASRADGLAFIAAVGVYACSRIILMALRGKLHEDIALVSTVASSGKYLLGNVVLFGLVAYGITHATPIYARFGLLGLSLVIIAFVEFYSPWKLLSLQADNLYTSLAIIAEAIDIKDPYTGRHSRRVTGIATKLARRLNLPESKVNTVRIGALLHDIGKIGVSGRIIRKPSSLESSELRAMQLHPVISANIMSPVEYFKEAALLVRHHHEHYDGTGYPDGLKGEEIPIGSRIILVADAFDAMTTDRPYRKGRSSQEALRILQERAGKQFDARVVKELGEISPST